MIYHSILDMYTQLKYFDTLSKKIEFIQGLKYGGINLSKQYNISKLIYVLLKSATNINDVKTLASFINHIFSPTIVCYFSSKKYNTHMTLLDTLLVKKIKYADNLIYHLKQYEFKHAHEVSHATLNSYYPKLIGYIHPLDYSKKY